MRIAITGATGNVGTSVLAALARDPAVTDVLAIARRSPVAPDALPGPTRFRAADVATDDLTEALRGYDVLIHLAWLIQPGRTEAITRAVNVEGTERVLAAAARAGVGAVVAASSIGAYSPGPKDRAVGEDWPTEGIPSSFYSRHKVAMERTLDRFEADQPQVRVVRLRPGLIFQRAAASEIRRLFAGPFLPGFLVREGLIPVVPSTPRLRLQAVDSRDVGEAYRLAAVNPEAQGAFNIAADPVLDPPRLAALLHARTVPVPARLLRAVAAATYHAHLQPTEPGWLDMGLGVPLISSERARRELGWTPQHSAEDAFLELLHGIRDGAGGPTPPLDRHAGGRLRLRELATGIGHRP